MGRHPTNRHSVTGYTDFMTALYFREFAAIKGWSLSQLTGHVLDAWAGQPSREDLNDLGDHRKTIAHLESGELECIPEVFKDEPYVPLRPEEIDTFMPHSFPDRVRLFVAKAKAGRSDEYPLPAAGPALLVAEHSKSNAAIQPHVSFGRKPGERKFAK